MTASGRPETTEQRVRVRGAALQVRRIRPPAGRARTGPVLVFLHEGLGCIAFWRGFPKRLVEATGLEAVVYDRRGYGRSSAVDEPRGADYLHVEAFDHLPRLLDRLGIDAVLPVGHSDGGTIALLFASRHPDRTRAAVTLAAHVFVDPVTLSGIRDTVERYRTGDLRARLAKYHGPNTRWVFHSWADTWLSEGFRRWNVEDRLAAIRCPVLVLQGTDDPYGGPEQVEAIAAGVGGAAQAVMLPDCGHTPHVDAPEATLACVRGFVERWIPPSPGDGPFREGGLR